MASFRPNIWQLQSRRDVPALVAALRHPDPEIRKRAAVALRILNAAQAVPALDAALNRETDDQVRKSLTAALSILDQRTDIRSLVSLQDVHGLIETLKSRYPEHVLAAAKALGELGDRTAVEPLVMLFQNSSLPPRVRLAAAEALLQLKSAPAVVTLLGALRRESWEVRRNAAAVLGQLQATWAVEPLATALSDSNSVVRRTAAAALRRIGTVEALAVLRTHLMAQMPPSAPQAEVEPVTVAAQHVREIPPLPPTLPEAEPEQASPPPAKPAIEPPRPRPVPLTTTDTQPIQVTVSPPAAPATLPEPPATITQPVKRLIAFLKRGRS